MTAPHYISENKSDIRGIKHDWYAVEDMRSCVSGNRAPFALQRFLVQKVV